MKLAITTALLAMTTMASAEPITTCQGSPTSLTIKVITPRWTFDATVDDNAGTTLVRDANGRTLASVRDTATGEPQMSLSAEWTPELARSVAQQLSAVFASEEVKSCATASVPPDSSWDELFCPYLCFPGPDGEPITLCELNDWNESNN